MIAETTRHALTRSVRRVAAWSLVVGLIGVQPITSTASPKAGQEPCRPGEHDGFRQYCRVAVRFTLDARKFSFEGKGSCGHGHGEWGLSAGPGVVTRPAKGWTLTVHFGAYDYGSGRAVDQDGKYGPANGYDEIKVSLALKAGRFVPPQSSLDVFDHAATVSLAKHMTRGSYRAHVAWASTARPHVLHGTFHCR